MNTNSTYSELLLDPAWKEKREYVLRTQGRECNRCGSTSRLQIHHRYYRSGAKPWEYPDECFEVLCRPCHREEHGLPIGRTPSKRKFHPSSTGRKTARITSAKAKPSLPKVVICKNNIPPSQAKLTEEQLGCRKWFWRVLLTGILFGGKLFPEEPVTLISWLVMIVVFGYGGYFSEK